MYAHRQWVKKLRRVVDGHGASQDPAEAGRLLEERFNPLSGDRVEPIRELERVHLGGPPEAPVRLLRMNLVFQL